MSAGNIESIAWAGEMPWHGLGKEVSNDLSVKEMQKAAGADWKVIKCPTFFEYEGNQLATGDQMLLRVNNDKTYNFLDTVSSGWNEVQNDDAFEFFHEWVVAGDMEMHTAGVLDEGKMVWVLAKVKDGFSLFRGKDRVESYLLFTNPHRYGSSITVASTPVRVVCQNTLQLALSTSQEDMTLRCDHRQPFDPDKVKEILNLNTVKLNKYKEAAELLSKKKAKKEDTIEYFAKIWPFGPHKDEKKLYSRNTQRAIDLITANIQPGAEFGPGTWWQNYNAVTFMHDHELNSSNINNRVRGIFYGEARQRKLKALNLALDYAKAA